MAGGVTELVRLNGGQTVSAPRPFSGGAAEPACREETGQAISTMQLDTLLQDPKSAVDAAGRGDGLRHLRSLSDAALETLLWSERSGGASLNGESRHAHCCRAPLRRHRPSNGSGPLRVLGAARPITSIDSAPRATTVSPLALEREPHGYFMPHSGRRCRRPSADLFRLDGPERPDPASLWQPAGVHGPSAVVLTERLSWTDRAGKASPAGPGVLRVARRHLYPGGDLRRRHSALGTARAGRDAVEIMPVAQFPGTRNWGYDGVLPTPSRTATAARTGLQRLVDACHAHGLAIFLDVVYNHFGPEGNYLAEFGPYFTDRYKTPWGWRSTTTAPAPTRARLCPGQRLHVAGRVPLRRPAPRRRSRHLRPGSAAHPAGHRGGGQRRRGPHRPAGHVVAESDLNDLRLLLPPERGGYGLDAQWSDDFHHAVHAC